MRYTTALVLAAAGLVAAQSSSTSAASSTSTSTSSSGSNCGAQLDLTIETCLTSTQPQVEACSANDWSCLCDASQQVNTCYNNCPSHPDAFGQQQTTDQYCAAAETYESSSSATGSATATSGTATGAATAASTSSDSSTAIQTGFAEQSGSASGAAASASESGNAANGFAPAGGLIAAIFGLALI